MKKLGDLKELDEGTKDKEDICLLLKKCGTKRVLAIYSLTYQRQIGRASCRERV